MTEGERTATQAESSAEADAAQADRLLAELRRVVDETTARLHSVSERNRDHRANTIGDVRSEVALHRELDEAQRLMTNLLRRFAVDD